MSASNRPDSASSTAAPEPELDPQEPSTDDGAPADASGRDLDESASPDDAEASTDAESVEDILDDIERVTVERDGYLADLQRVSAEFANFRKQTERRHGELVEQAGVRLAESLLPVLDACDAAIEQGVEGVEPIRQQLVGVLEHEGLERIGEPDAAFDPNRHEAVMTEPADDNDGDEGPVVAEVLRWGYAWNGRVFRPAMVKVRG